MIKNKFSFLLIFVIYLFNACSPNNVTVENDLEPYFQKHQVEGTFGLFNNGPGTFTIYNLARFKDSVYLPASTFKIINSLVGLQTGVIVDENMVIPWDGKKRSFENWNQNLTMQQAFTYSAVPYYQEVARRIGKDTMQQWLDTLGYGSKDGRAVIHDIDTFWLDNSIQVTSDEQLGLVKKLYFNQLPFQKRAQEIVKRIMLQEDNANYKLSYKTGWGIATNGKAVGWVVGWIEENRHPYFFVLNIESDYNEDIPAIRMDILQLTLKHLGFFEGKK